MTPVVSFVVGKSAAFVAAASVIEAAGSSPSSPVSRAGLFEEGDVGVTPGVSFDDDAVGMFSESERTVPEVLSTHPGTRKCD